jgi:hypothetical protein
MASTYSGAAVRTSHVSGLFTDIGLFLGQLSRGVPLDRRRLYLCSILAFSFFVGSAAGGSVFGALGYGTLYIPAALTGATGLAYGLYRHFFRDALLP